MQIKVTIKVWEIRNRKGLSLEQLEELSGVSKTNINDLENGSNSNPTIETICRLAAAFDVRPEELYEYEA